MLSNIQSNGNKDMKKNISKILCPYDGSESSNFAFNNTLNLAKSLDSEILVLTCIKDRATFGFFKLKSDKENIKNQKKWAEKRISQLQTECDEKGISMKSKIVKCDIISNEVIDYAKKENVDIITMSNSKNRTPAEKMYSESMVDKVMEKTPCTFVLIK